jgi:hypothetical protein
MLGAITMAMRGERRRFRPFCASVKPVVPIDGLHAQLGAHGKWASVPSGRVKSIRHLGDGQAARPDRR